MTQYDYDLFVIGAGSGGVRDLNYVQSVPQCSSSERPSAQCIMASTITRLYVDRLKADPERKTA